MDRILLRDGWQLKAHTPDRSLDDELAAEGWLPAQVPGGVYEALLAAQQLPDPFYDRNELDVQWVAERDWLYRCTFSLSAAEIARGPIALCCDGLDTFATVLMNGVELFRSDNMFVPQRHPIGDIVRPGANELVILFESALRCGRQLEAEHGKRPLWNGDSSRLYVRKAQYHYGWDWGPTLLTSGPWQAVRLEIGAARLSEVFCRSLVAEDLASADLPVQVRIELPAADMQLRLTLLEPRGVLLDEITVPATELVAYSFAVAAPQLWWPNGYGAQPLYTLAIELLAANGEIVDRGEQRIGLRRLQLLQDPLTTEPGRSFVFAVNNTPIFAGGANWIPADSFTTRLTPECYRRALAQAAAANMTMIRVWGGGIYEQDAFYDACDELGLLVWQDFMFACGIYPAHAKFQASVRAEAEAQLRRLRHHPAIVLWCGNNEDYQIAESLGLYDANFDGDFLSTPFPARAIYERLLPAVFAELDPDRLYWPGSPYGGSSVADQTVGDRHTWDVWHGTMAPYAQYPRYGARFVSEFGMQAAPHLRTLEACLSPHECYPASRSFEHHNKAEGGPRRLAAYLSDVLRLPLTLEDYVYGTQLVQAEALLAAFGGFRRRWRGPGEYACGGALVWQLNDCWPVTSWAIVDHALRPKPAYYIVRRALAPLALGLVHEITGPELWAVNGTLHQIEAELLLTRYALDGTLRDEERRPLVLKANRAVELAVLAPPEDDEVLAARLEQGGRVLARAGLWPLPYKYLNLPDAAVAIERVDEDTLRITAKRPARGVWFDAGDEVAWSDNFIDLLPGDSYVLQAINLGKNEIVLRYLGGRQETGDRRRVTG
jgi:beta-mannosidase